jgi:putative transposase
MILAHKIRLDLTQEQKIYFRKAAGTARFVYNWGLAEWQRMYQAGEKPTALKIKKKFNTIKQDQFPWVLDVTKCAPEGAFMNLGNAFSNFFQGRAKYPKFKKKGKHDSFYLANDKFHVHGRRIKIPKLGWVRMRESLRFSGKIQSAVVSCAAGKWFVSIAVELDRLPPPCKSHATVGVDLGIHTLATLSTGEVWENPRVLASRERRLKRLQRQLGKKQKGSKNRAKARQRLAKQYHKVANVRNDMTHKLTSFLVSRFGIITIEDLNVNGMLKNHTLAKHIADANFGEIRRQLTYKVELYRNTLFIVDHFFPSSQLCSCCGHLKAELTLTDRTYVCKVCGMRKDRDVNAAENLHRAGLARIHACGHDGAVSSRRVHETTSMDEAGSENLDECLHLSTLCRAEILFLLMG